MRCQNCKLKLTQKYPLRSGDMGGGAVFCSYSCYMILFKIWNGKKL